jgi:hypothetical protein
MKTIKGFIILKGEGEPKDVLFVMGNYNFAFMWVHLCVVRVWSVHFWNVVNMGGYFENEHRQQN